MWISNHTAPVLCTSIILPIIRDFQFESGFTRALLLGLAFACNFGGMITPISSMQNAMTVSFLDNIGIEIGFGEWIAIAAPVCIIGVIGAWAIIITIYG